ncbi:MAG: phosphoesterase [Myxococcales bacterium 68-20]|nr:polyprenyl synthetase family protein [Myxococcales bacterium]OJY18299.1 MAG: phosphoesterase [Myxococcales bacterium 68-20]
MTAAPAITASRVDVRGYLRDCRTLAVEEIQRFVPRDTALGPVLYDLVLDYPLRDAKGLRPALCLAACRALGGAESAALPTAAVIELYHNAFLVHDDIEDGSERRRDSPTLHREHGVAIAINVGDAMLALALEPLLDNTRLIGLGKSLRILQVVAQMARETAEGQAMELDWVRHPTRDVTDDDYRQMVVKKTGWYSFIAPVTLGAIIAGATSEQIATLHRFAEELGIAFQIRDDVLNLEGDEVRYGKESCGDLWEGKRTLMLLHMMRSVSPEDRREVTRILAAPRPEGASSSTLDVVDVSLLAKLEAEGHLTEQGRRRLERHLHERDASHVVTKTAADVEFLFQRIQANGSLAHANRVAREHAQRARSILDSADAWLARSVHRDLLYALVDFTIGRET